MAGELKTFTQKMIHDKIITVDLLDEMISSRSPMLNAEIIKKDEGFILKVTCKTKRVASRLPLNKVPRQYDLREFGYKDVSVPVEVWAEGQLVERKERVSLSKRLKSVVGRDSK